MMKYYGIFLESFDAKSKTATVKFVTQYDDDITTRTKPVRMNVSISPILVWRILNRKEIVTNHRYAGIRLRIGDDYVGQWFWSTDNDQNYWKNPFVLKHFKPTDGSNIPENFGLYAVDEVSYYDTYKQKYRTGRKRLSSWKRYMECNVKKYSEDMIARIVLPYKHIVEH